VRCESLGPLNFDHWSLFRISRFVLRICPWGRGRMAEAKCAKRTQFGRRARKWARGGRPRCSAGGRLCKTNPISCTRGRTPEAKCAKRTQFPCRGRWWAQPTLPRERGPCGGDLCKTNPIQSRSRTPDGGNCAKRTQFGPAGHGVPGRGCQVRSFKCQVRDRKGDILIYCLLVPGSPHKIYPELAGFPPRIESGQALRGNDKDSAWAKAHPTRLPAGEGPSRHSGPGALTRWC
jgi:hypothetical protein